MRIIVTKNGKIIIKELGIEKSIGTIEEKSNKKKHRCLSGLQLPGLRKNKKFSTFRSFYDNVKRPKCDVNHITKSVVYKKSMSDYFNRDESIINKKELKQAKNIKLTKTKLNISQHFLRKYDDLDEIYRNKIRNLEDTLRSSAEKKNEKEIINEANEQNQYNFFNNNDGNEKNNEKVEESKKQIFLRDIISRNNLIHLKSKFAKEYIGHDDMRIPLDSKNKNSYNFRSKYNDQNTVNKYLTLILSLPVNSDRINLIKYYKQNKDISPFYFEKLAKCNEAKMYKLNKICQVMFHKQEEEMKELKIIKQKVMNKDKMIKQRGSKYFNPVDKIINKTSEIISDYNLKKVMSDLKKEKIIRGETKKIKKKYWDKYCVNNFIRDKKGLEQNCFSSKENEELQSKKILNINKSSPKIFA